MRSHRKWWLVGTMGLLTLSGAWALYRTATKSHDACCQGMAAGVVPAKPEEAGALPPGHPDISELLPPGHPDISSMMKGSSPSAQAEMKAAPGNCPYLATHPEAKAGAAPVRSKT